MPCRKPCPPQGQGANLVAVAAALSVWIGQGKTADELAILASLFDLMRSNLALMALNTVSDERPQGRRGRNPLTKGGKVSIIPEKPCAVPAGRGRAEERMKPRWPRNTN